MKLPSFIHLEKTPKRLERGEYRHVGLLRLLTIFIMGLFVLGGFQTMIFLYEQVYQSIQRAEAIVVLRSEIGVETIDFEQFRRVANAWERKYATTTVYIARDPFVVGPLTATTTP